MSVLNDYHSLLVKKGQNLQSTIGQLKPMLEQLKTVANSIQPTDPTQGDVEPLKLQLQQGMDTIEYAVGELARIEATSALPG